MSERFITISRSDSSKRKPNTDTIVEQHLIMTAGENNVHTNLLQDIGQWPFDEQLSTNPKTTS